MRAIDLPQYYNAVNILEHNLAGRADKVALYSPATEMTFRQVSDLANQVGNGLKQLDVRMGECVALLAPDSAEFVASFFGVIKIGAVVASMNTLLTPPEHAYILNDCRARVLIVHASLLPAVQPIRDTSDFLQHVIVIGGKGRDGDLNFEDWTAAQSTRLGTAPTHREDLCTLNYSSGTTGEPKGIFHAQKDLPLTAENWGTSVLGLGESDRTFAAAKLFFTFGTGGNLIFPWYCGASIVLFPGAPRIATNLLEMIDRFKPTIFYNAPTSYAAMLAIPDFTEKYDLSSLRLCVSAGEALPAPVWQGWKERTGLDIIDGIGSTEIYHIFISNRPGDIRPGSSGKPVPGYQVKLVDEEGQPVPQGQVGNLMVKSESAAQFYLHQYARSQRTFIGEWVYTGDKYFVDEDGYYWHAGRSDDMMKVGGIWVSPVEVESTLMSHPAVLECAVVAYADSANLIKPKAIVVLKEGYAPSDQLTAELISYCREHMAEYKRPRVVEFVKELPKTATGKIQRFKMRQLA